MKGQNGKQASKNSKYLFILFFIAILALAILIVKPFIPTLIMAAIVAYVAYPAYSYLSRITGMKKLSAIALIVLLLLILSIPLALVVGKLTSESYTAYQKVKIAFLDSDSFETSCANNTGVTCRVYQFMTAPSNGKGLDLSSEVARGFSGLAAMTVSKASDFVMDVPKLLLHMFIAIFAMYYMLIQGKDMLEGLKRVLPLKREDSERILLHFNDIIYATIYGSIVIALVQGALATIGYFVFGVTSPVLMGILTLIAAFIPFLGSALVWLPVSLMMLANGLITGNNSMLVRATGLIIYGALIVSMVDNFLRPKIVGHRAGVHPLIILLGVFGGIALFGFAGVMVGPLLLTLFIASLKIYEEEKQHIM
jgi:predicted PurR-regulated permease PerM